MRDLDKTLQAAAENLQWDILYMNIREEAAVQAKAVFAAACAEVREILTKDAAENDAVIRELYFRDSKLLAEEHRGELVSTYNPITDKVEVRRLTGELLWEDPPSKHVWWSIRGFSDDYPDISVGIGENMHIVGKLLKQTREATAAAIIEHHPEGDDSDATDLEQLGKAMAYWRQYEADKGFCMNVVG